MEKLNNDDKWAAIAQNYLIERETISFPSLLLDDLILSLISNESQSAILDYGSGSGTLSRLISKTHDNFVVAYEPIEAMMKVFNELTDPIKYPKIIPITNEEKINSLNIEIKTIICINVFDHIKDILVTLKYFFSILPSEGKLILSIPHPLKNIGKWIKEEKNGTWEYLYYQLDGYLEEIIVNRNREDINGNLIIDNVLSYHRTISTYYNLIIESGFQIKKMYEPSPSNESKVTLSTLHTQAYRIPYFWVLECVKT